MRQADGTTDADKAQDCIEHKLGFISQQLTSLSLKKLSPCNLKISATVFPPTACSISVSLKHPKSNAV